MHAGKGLRDEVEEGVSYMVEWNIKNEIERSLHNTCEYTGRDEANYRFFD